MNPNPTEHQEACILADWLRIKHVPFIHVPNEGKRSYQVAARLKKAGLSPGFPDYLIFMAPPAATQTPGWEKDAACVGAAIELKRKKGGKPTRSQVEWLKTLQANGWAVCVAYGADDAIKWLEELGY